MDDERTVESIWMGMAYARCGCKKKQAEFLTDLRLLRFANRFRPKSKDELTIEMSRKGVNNGT